MDGYGNDVTATFYDPGTDPNSSLNTVGLASPSASDGSGAPGDGTAQAIAQIFSTGVTAYVDSQAIQRGYSINNPRYFQSGYPAGQSVPYAAAPQGASITAPNALTSSSGGGLLFLLIVGVIIVALAKG